MTESTNTMELSTEDYDALLKNWVQLNKVVMTLTEQELFSLLNRELGTRARVRTMMRIYNRYSKVRSTREKREFSAQAKG